MPTTTISFEELPVLVECGLEAGNLNGGAEISFYADGEWFVKRIWLDAHRQTTKAERDTGLGLYVTGQIDVHFDPHSPSWLYLAIWGQLTEGRFKRQIDKVVAAEIEETLPAVAPQRRHAMAVV